MISQQQIKTIENLPQLKQQLLEYLNSPNFYKWGGGMGDYDIIVNQEGPHAMNDLKKAFKYVLALQGPINQNNIYNTLKQINEISHGINPDLFHNGITCNISLPVTNYQEQNKVIEYIKNIVKIPPMQYEKDYKLWAKQWTRVQDEKFISTLFTDYQKKIQQSDNNENKVKHILSFAIQLIHIHPFRDGNGRTIKLMLIKLCLDNNIFPPIIKFLDMQSKNDWISEIKQGQDKFQELLKQKNQDINIQYKLNKAYVMYNYYHCKNQELFKMFFAEQVMFQIKELDLNELNLSKDKEVLLYNSDKKLLPYDILLAIPLSNYHPTLQPVIDTLKMDLLKKMHFDSMVLNDLTQEYINQFILDYMKNFAALLDPKTCHKELLSLGELANIARDLSQYKYNDQDFSNSRLKSPQEFLKDLQYHNIPQQIKENFGKYNNINVIKSLIKYLESKDKAVKPSSDELKALEQCIEQSTLSKDFKDIVKNGGLNLYNYLSNIKVPIGRQNIMGHLMEEAQKAKQGLDNHYEFYYQHLLENIKNPQLAGDNMDFVQDL